MLRDLRLCCNSFNIVSVRGEMLRDLRLCCNSYRKRGDVT